MKKGKSEFTIKVSMEDRWIPYFLTFLKRMEVNGKVGHSELLGFYSDGDGDFRPKFDFEGVEFDNTYFKTIKPLHSIEESIEFFDGG